MKLLLTVLIRNWFVIIFNNKFDFIKFNFIMEESLLEVKCSCKSYALCEFSTT